MKDSGLEFSEQLVASGDNSIGSGEACAARLLKLEPPPTAIIAANDDMAAGVVRFADRLGVKIPDQLSVTGFDDIVLARQIYPSLTTIRQPLTAMAERAAAALLKANNGTVPEKGTEIVSGSLEIRESTGPAPE